MHVVAQGDTNALGQNSGIRERGLERVEIVHGIGAFAAACDDAAIVIMDEDEEETCQS